MTDVDINELTALIKQAVQEAMPKQWLTSKELCKEFSIGRTKLCDIIQDPLDPLPYTSLCAMVNIYLREKI